MNTRTHFLIAFAVSRLVVALPLSAEEPVETLRAQVEELRADLNRPTEAFNLRYKEQLTTLKEMAQAGGDLDLTVAAAEELSNYLNGGSKPATLPKLKRLQEIYGDHSARLKRESAEREIELLQGYGRRLDAAMAERTRADDIDAALTYRNEVLAVEAEIKALATGMPLNRGGHGENPPPARRMLLRPSPGDEVKTQIELLAGTKWKGSQPNGDEITLEFTRDTVTHGEDRTLKLRTTDSGDVRFRFPGYPDWVVQKISKSKSSIEVKSGAGREIRMRRTKSATAGSLR